MGNAELTPEPMMTERNCMKVVGRLSEPSLLMPSGKRSTKNGQRDQQRSFLSGSVRGQARKLEMLRPLRVRKMVVRKHLQKKKRKRRSKSYALNKSTFDLPNISGSLFFYRRTGFFLLLRSGFFKLPDAEKKFINTFLTYCHLKASPTGWLSS